MNRLAPLIMLIALGGCPGDDSIAIDDLPTALQSAECDFEVRCELVVDQATCLAALPFNTTDELSTIADVHAGTVNYDAKLAKQCVDAFETLGCSLSAVENSLATACIDMFSGTIATGAACGVDEECVDHGNCAKTDDTCDPTMACCAGTCVAVPAKTAIGGACGDTGSGCVDGAYCDTPAGAQAGTCKAQVDGEGTVCDASDACAAPRECVITTGTTGTCKTLPDEGQACDATSFLGCSDLRDYCDNTTSVCTHRAVIGDACGGTTGVSCVGFARCDTTTLKCVGKPGLGQACDETTGLDCFGELQCINTKCVAPLAGMTCSSP